MNIQIKDLFILKWKQYFNNSDLPITFCYTDNPVNATIVSPSGKWNCLICELQKVKSGQSLAFSSEAVEDMAAEKTTASSNPISP